MVAGKLILNNVHYTVAHGDLLPKGRRALVREFRDVQDSDPARQVTRTWQLSGPIGQSRQAPNGFLGHDWSDLETRWDDLLTSAPPISTTTLSTFDPVATQHRQVASQPGRVAAAESTARQDQFFAARQNADHFVARSLLGAE